MVRATVHLPTAVAPMIISREIDVSDTEEPRSEGAIVMSDAPTKVLGDPLSKIWWQGRQWAVTEHGVEKRDGTYHFEAARLNETRPGNPHILDWPAHMVEKEWLDFDDFLTAFLIALTLHATRLPPEVSIRDSIDFAIRERAYLLEG